MPVGELPSLYGHFPGAITAYFEHDCKGIVQGEDLGITHSVTLNADGNRWGFKISFGNDGAHNNLTPSTATYIWRRSS